MYCFSILSFFFNDTATTEIYTLSLHDALPISISFCYTNLIKLFYYSYFCFPVSTLLSFSLHSSVFRLLFSSSVIPITRSEEHTSELQSRRDLVCRLLLEKKKKKIIIFLIHI